MPDKDMSKFERGGVFEGMIYGVSPDMLRVNLGNGMDGFISKSDVSRDPKKRDTARFKLGDRVNAEFISVGDDGKVKLSIRAIEVRAAQKEKENAELEIYKEAHDKWLEGQAEIKKQKEKEAELLRQNAELEAAAAIEARREAEAKRLGEEKIQRLAWGFKVAAAAVVVGVGIIVAAGRIMVAASEARKNNFNGNNFSIYNTPLRLAPMGPVNISTNGGVVMYEVDENGEPEITLVELGPNGIGEFKIPGDDTPYYFASEDSSVWDVMGFDFDEAYERTQQMDFIAPKRKQR